MREAGCTAVIVSHDPESARIADRIVRIRDGRVSEEWARDDERGDTIVVGRGGWLRLPEELLLRAGIADRATAKLESGVVIVEAAAGIRAAGRDRRRHRVASAARASRSAVVAEARGLRKRYGATAVLDGPGRVVPRAGGSTR